MQKTDVTKNPKRSWTWVYDLLLLVVLLVGGYFRFVGSDWGQLLQQHPDELFLTSVTYDIHPVSGLAAYFNTATSTLNPHNVGHGFFVYGTLPIFIVRGLADLTCALSPVSLAGHSLADSLHLTCQLNNLKLFGRQLSALADLGAVALLYFLVKRLYGARVGLLAALFSALAVEEIQQSHFYTTDNFTTFFLFLALFFAVEILSARKKPVRDPETGANDRLGAYLKSLFSDRLLWLSAAFGFAVGMAMASKINAAPVAFLLPAALVIRYLNYGEPVQVEMKKAVVKKGEPPAPRAVRSFGDFVSKNLALLIIGGIFALLAFRIFQPYAFAGLGLNPKWVANIREQQAQATPNSDLPWALQWANRTHLYSGTNLTQWGLGLPLGILAWIGFLWMAWRMWKGEWRKHILLWSWTAFYFVWQSLQFNPTMRYQLPIYPLLAMMAAWVVFEWARPRVSKTKQFNWGAFLAGLVGGTVLLLTLGWAYAFSRIYVNDEPRVAASNWIYQNIPGPINLKVQTAGGSTVLQPLPFPAGANLRPDSPYTLAFVAQTDGKLDQLYLSHVAVQELKVSIWQNLSDSQPLASGILAAAASQAEPANQTVEFSQAPSLISQQTYTITVETVTPDAQVDLCGPLQLGVLANNQTVEQTVDPGAQCQISASQPLQAQFVSNSDGLLDRIVFTHVNDLVRSAVQTVSFTLSDTPGAQNGQTLTSGSVTADFSTTTDPHGVPVSLKPDRPVSLKQKSTYYLNLTTSGGALALTGASVTNETDYDWALPFSMSGYDPYGGIYSTPFIDNYPHLQVYWEDNAMKLARFESILDQTEYIFIPTNHQYAQITRLPERYPMTTVYYRQLIGCPPDKDIIWCYENGEPGMFKGNLGFKLVATFEDYPTIGPLKINDETAEEAFTFYDHPKVLIFQKTADYTSARVQSILGAVDMSNALHLTPAMADQYKSLMLPAAQLASQQAGGTWSDLFNRNAIYNRYPVVGLLLWYVFIFLLGLFIYPVVRAAFPGLADHGYPLARIVGLLLWAWLAWMAGSLGLTYSRLTIAAALGLIVLLGLWLAWRQRSELMQEIRDHWKRFLLVEAVFLGFFLIDLFIRLGNSDFWHPAKGGERPMDFAYFNAILKSTSFPPYDPWFAGGYINYYYYGYVIVGTPVKLLGIDPSIAYNFILPTLFACVAMAAFSIGWNLMHSLKAIIPTKPSRAAIPGRQADSFRSLFDLRFIGGIASSSAMVLLGNLGIVRMLYQGFQQIASPGGLVDPKASVFQHFGWAVQGFFMTLAGGMHLPYGPGDWYWFPSRALPDSSGSPITEFPIFTFIYSDLHAHMIALMVTILAVAWVLSILQAKAKWKAVIDGILGFFLGGLIIGALKPTNTWDFYTYLILGCVVLAYTVWRYADVSRLPFKIPAGTKRFLLTAGAVATLVGIAILFYEPFTHWFLLDPSYTKVYPWQGGRSNISSYLVHWGLFLFFIFTWMLWETRQWLAETPASALKKLRPYAGLIVVLFLALILALVFQQYWVMKSSQSVPWKGITILWLAMPLAAWAAVLLLRPGMPDSKRLVLFMIGTGLLLTMIVEIIVMGGDIGRMNTVFKIYYQAWVLLGISAAAAFGWLLPELRKWLPGWRMTWQVAAAALTAGAALFILMGGLGKVQDRMAPSAPRTLNSLTFMKYAVYNERGANLDLSEDYRAILWMQDNVKGSPVIAESPSAGIQYEWFNRFSIYTGLPDVVGWEWHQEQQRVMFTNLVRQRGQEEDAFYATTDIQAALDFIRTYNVRYIVVGQLERAKYQAGGFGNFAPAGGPDGLAKFEQYDGKYWKVVYKDAKDGQTVIYQVLP